MEKVFELTNPQKNIWLLETVYGGTSINIIAGGMKILSGFDAKRAIETINKYVQTNEAMRLVLLKNLEQFPKQQIKEFVYKKYEYIDVSTLSAKEVLKLKLDLVERPLNLEETMYDYYVLDYGKGSGEIFFKANHMICDAWGCAKMTEQLSRIYVALEENTNECIINIPSYSEYIETEKEYMSSSRYTQDKEFWEEYLRNVLDVVSMKPNVLENNVIAAKRYEYKLSNIENKKIQEYCTKEHVSAYNVFMTGVAMYMSRVNQKYDFCIGTPVLNRANFREKQMQGMFISTMPVRIKLNCEETDTFSDVCHMLSKDSMSTFRHSKYPYLECLRRYREEYGSGGLFRVAMSYQNARSDMVDKERFKMDWLFSDKLQEDMVIHVMDLNDTNTMHLCLDYKVTQFSKEEIKYIAKRIMHCIMDGIKLNKSLKNIEIMPKEELSLIVDKYNGKVTKYPRHARVFELWQEVVKKHIQNIAVKTDKCELTYGQVDELSIKIGQVISKNDIKALDTVAISMEKSELMVATMLACVKLGVCFVPIDKSYNDERKKYMYNNAKCKVCITDKEIIDKDISVLVIDKNITFDNTVSINVLPKEYDAVSPVCILYTSGTTGMPKGAIVTNRNIIKLVRNTDYIKITSKDKILQGSSTSFDVSLIEIWGGLLNGATVCLIDKTAYVNPELLKKHLLKNNITIMLMTSALLNQMIDSDITMFKNLNVILTGGDVMSIKHAKKFKKRYPKITLLNCYGPTECATTNAYNVTKFNFLKVPIGRSVSNTKGYVLDKKNRILPMYVAGEYVIAGDGVTKGYINNLEMTDKKYIMNDIDKIYKGTYMYKTGDIVSFARDGNIEFFGRKDNQVKINGYRIELDEIKVAIMSMNNVVDATVVVNELNNSKQIIAMYTSKVSVKESDMLAYLKNKLPYFMIPKSIINVDKFPMNVHGKVDVIKLKEVIKASIHMAPSENMKELSGVYKKLYNIFTTILKLDSINIEDSFFDVGGDSLLAITLVTNAINQGINITYSELYKYPSIKKLGEHIDKRIKDVSYDEKIADYDYSAINNVLQNQTFEKLEIQKVERVLLTGATGFLGIHLLQAILEGSQTSKVYCLIRDKKSISIKTRLLDTLHYYFDKKYDSLIDDRIIPIAGDIGQSTIFTDESYSIKIMKNVDIVINSAAYVKHFGDAETFDNINHIGVQNLCELCLKYDCKLVHISTLSVSGNEMKANAIVSSQKQFDENKLYIGQSLDSVYSYTKFLGERTVLEYVATKGLNAVICRMGNLTGRYVDGKFQINEDENAFLKKLRAFIQIKAIPENIVDTNVEFTPVDVAARATILLSGLKSRQIVYHILNENHLTIQQIICMLNNEKVDIQVVSSEKMSKIISYYLQSDEGNKIIEGLIEDIGSSMQIEYKQEVIIKYNKTIELLKQLNFLWPKIDIKYIVNYIELEKISKKGEYDVANMS